MACFGLVTILDFQSSDVAVDALLLWKSPIFKTVLSCKTEVGNAPVVRARNSGASEIALHSCSIHMCARKHAMSVFYC